MVVWQTINGSEMAYYRGKFVGIAGNDNGVYFAGFKTEDEAYISVRGFNNLEECCQMVEYAVQRHMTYDEWIKNRKELLAV